MKRGSSSASVCIATYKRPLELAACLDALMRQTEPPDDIIISDAGGDAETREVIDAYRRRQEALVVHCPTPRAALPWQRWWAFEHCAGTFVLFLDDDIRLAPRALSLLRKAYQRRPNIAGAGFSITYDGADEVNRSQPTDTLRTRWLGIGGARPGSVTPGGITIDLPTIDIDLERRTHGGERRGRGWKFTACDNAGTAAAGGDAGAEAGSGRASARDANGASHGGDPRHRTRGRPGHR